MGEYFSTSKQEKGRGETGPKDERTKMDFNGQTMDLAKDGPVNRRG